MKLIKIILTITIIFGVNIFSTGQTYKKIIIAAAANLKVALDSIITTFKKQYPEAEVQVIYGASGKLYEQISSDAPFDIFLSADMDYPNKLKEKNYSISDVKIYAIGQLVIWSKKTDPNILQLNSLLEPGLNKISIANPKTAPYGEKAVQCMKYYKVYDKIKNKLVFGENISQTAQFVTTGAADIGLVALSLVLTPNMQKEKGKYFIIPDESHKPLEQGCVILKHAKGNKIAIKFFNFISSAKAVNILKYYGYIQKKR